MRNKKIRRMNAAEPHISPRYELVHRINILEYVHLGITTNNFQPNEWYYKKEYRKFPKTSNISKKYKSEEDNLIKLWGEGFMGRAKVHDLIYIIASK